MRFHIFSGFRTMGSLTAQIYNEPSLTSVIRWTKGGKLYEFFWLHCHLLVINTKSIVKLHFRLWSKPKLTRVNDWHTAIHLTFCVYPVWLEMVFKRIALAYQIRRICCAKGDPPLCAFHPVGSNLCSSQQYFFPCFYKCIQYSVGCLHPSNQTDTESGDEFQGRARTGNRISSFHTVLYSIEAHP